MLKKLKNILVKFFENSQDKITLSFILSLIFFISGNLLGNVIIKSILFIAATASAITCIASAYVEAHKLKEEKKENETPNIKAHIIQEENYEQRGLRGNKPVIMNSYERQHTNLETYINNIRFLEYLMAEIGYPGYEQDIQKLDFFKVMATPNTGQETLDQLDFALNDLKNEVCDKIDSYCEHINAKPQSPRRRYKK